MWFLTLVGAITVISTIAWISYAIGRRNGIVETIAVYRNAGIKSP